MWREEWSPREHAAPPPQPPVDMEAAWALPLLETSSQLCQQLINCPVTVGPRAKCSQTSLRVQVGPLCGPREVAGSGAAGGGSPLLSSAPVVVDLWGGGPGPATPAGFPKGGCNLGLYAKYPYLYVWKVMQWISSWRPTRRPAVGLAQGLCHGSPPRPSGISIFQLLELNLHASLPFHNQASLWDPVSLPRPQSPNWV